ncbi:DUF6421 family protein [Pseudonocardia sp. HH130630-07]|uniref:DUF6421 family protein n=1 Tax=Pseudonocardia sp. HH130630-07 TaxID=1690815 RepID=UPI000815178E|nr:DUF6421 family protein [Pseudonocardia sp. HH130630-07]ANY06181.1 hypothetical protein AFB00_07580 [Pseudonocardia sp. HH130630-07]
MRAATAELHGAAREVSALADGFRAGQDRDGSVPGAGPDDIALLRAIVRRSADALLALGAERQLAALRSDTDAWIAAGLHTAPDFGATRDSFAPPGRDELAFFVGCALTTNSAPPVGRRMECFLVRRREPREIDVLAEFYPHPKNNCQSVVLLTGSAGFRSGNCLVFFPENVPSSRPVESQSYALFFFNKFRRIHEELAIPPAGRIMVDRTAPAASTGLRPDVCYDARSVWGYLHDYHHHQGRWPLDENVALKTNWFVGLLEETKVDAKTVLAAVDDDRVPFRDEQIDMILLERLVRYPRSRVATRNFDAGTGVFLYSWFRERGGIGVTPGGLRFDRAAAISALREYVREIEDLEERVSTPDLYRSEAISYVRRYLREGEDRDRFAFSPDQENLLLHRSAAEDDQLVFADGEL